MMKQIIKEAFQNSFDLVGMIPVNLYNDAILNKDRLAPTTYKTMVVVGLNYPSSRRIRQSKTHLVPSIYTFGQDYHNVLKERLNDVCKTLGYAYQIGVDNHQIDERLAATLSGMGYKGKNQLIINESFGTYFFIGIALLDVEIKTEVPLIEDGCLDCDICIKACPTGALNKETGYDMAKCISYYNQEKKELTNEEIKKNYILFGCDICQTVCPKNIGVKELHHDGFKLNGNEQVDITDLFKLSAKDFKNKYHDSAYLWRGKTILMRNALTILLRQKNTAYNELIRQSIIDYQSVIWYTSTASKILELLERN